MSRNTYHPLPDPVHSYSLEYLGSVAHVQFTNSSVPHLTGEGDYLDLLVDLFIEWNHNEPSIREGETALYRGLTITRNQSH